MKLKTIFLALMAGFLTFTTYAAEDKKFEVINEERNVGKFDEININGRFTVKLVNSNREYLSISALENVLPLVETKAKRGVLTIEMVEPEKKKGFFDKLKEKYSDYITRQPIVITIYTNHFNALYATGATNVESENLFRTEKLEIELGGVSKANVNLETKETIAKLTGTARLAMKGNTELLKLNANGTAIFDGLEQTAQDADVKTAGAANVSVNVKQAFSGNAGGASVINCYENPQSVKRQVSMAAKIELK